MLSSSVVGTAGGADSRNRNSDSRGVESERSATAEAATCRSGVAGMALRTFHVGIHKTEDATAMTVKRLPGL